MIESGDPRSRPVLAKQFGLTHDSLLKAKIAEALVELGTKDGTFYNYLVQLATSALDSNVPDGFNRDSRGNEFPGPPPALIAWAEEHHKTIDVAGQEAIYIYPGYVGLLASAGDARANPLLRRALRSPNYIVEAYAAKGLVNCHDPEAVPLILDALRNAPKDAKPVFAQALVYLDDAQAQAAVDATLPAEWAASMWAAKAKGGTVFRH